MALGGVTMQLYNQKGYGLDIGEGWMAVTIYRLYLPPLEIFSHSIIPIVAIFKQLFLQSHNPKISV